MRKVMKVPLKKKATGNKKVSVETAGAVTTKRSANFNNLLTAASNGMRVLMTPEIAKELLAINTNNRRVKKERVLAYGRSMARGQWQFTGDAIRVARKENGEQVIVDGQHRLLACVEANVSFETMLFTNLDYGVFTVIDRGVSRTNGDLLGVIGTANGTTVGALVRPIIAVDAGLNPLQHGTMILVTGEDLVAFVQENEELVQWALSMGIKGATGVGGIKSAWAMFAIIAARERNKRLVEKFVEETAKGVGLYEGDPRLALRSFMLKTGTSHGQNARNYREAGTILRAFNAYVEGRPLLSLKPWGTTIGSVFPKVTSAPVYDWANRPGTLSADDED